MSYLFIRLRSSRPEVFCKKSFLRNFAKFTGKQLSQSFFFNKFAGLRSATLLKKKFWHRCFPVNFAKFIRTPFFTEHLWWLLLQAFISKWSRLIIQVIFSRFPLKPILCNFIHLCSFIHGCFLDDHNSLCHHHYHRKHYFLHYSH